MIEKAKEILMQRFSKQIFDKIVFEHLNCYNELITRCYLYPVYFRSFPIVSHGENDEQAFDNAIKLYNKSKPLEELISKKIKESKKSQSAIKIENYVVYFKNCLSNRPLPEIIPAISDIVLMDGFFSIVDEPYLIKDSRVQLNPLTQEDRIRLNERFFSNGEYLITDDGKVVRNENNAKGKIYGFPEVKEDEELYWWYDIKCLSGDAGLTVVKDGKVIKTWTILFS